MAKNPIFTEKEIFELRELISQIDFPMKLNEDKTDNTLDLDFSGKIFFQSILRKKPENYFMDYVTARGENTFLEHKEWNTFKYHIKQWILSLKRTHPFTLERKENIENISPTFYNLFKEAKMIDNLGFKESSGMIYRKTLEILIKDFLIFLLPDQFTKKIQNNTVGRIIRDFYEITEEGLKPKVVEKFAKIQRELIELKSLFKIVNNTFQIGNDFSHYERRLQEYSSSDMDKNIEKISDFIDHLVEGEKLKLKREKLNKEFDLDNLI